jgi:hypothetical protein
MPAVNGVGEPCAGKPHARFDAAGAGNGADLTRSTGVAQPTGKPAEHEGPRLYRQRVTAPAPDPTRWVRLAVLADAVTCGWVAVL